MMRIKWTRHLDGSSSRRPEDETGTQEADEKKSSKNSSPSIFKIFRRKKSRRRDEDDNKNKGSNGNVPPLQSEADEDDTASVSSVATCASQPVTEGFQRERASSLFSSFRLSLPGSKRKKRKVAPTPSETILNGEDNEPQMERYSTPDLRKTSDKLVSPASVQTNLCTSSPSIRSPKESSSSAQSLIRKNSDSFDKIKWSNLKRTTSSTSKLSKSVSFSDCGDSLIDSSHSKFDNKVLRAVNSKPMVEEDSEALESELPVCMNDNPCMSHENKTSTDDDSSSSLLNAPSSQDGSHSDVGCVSEMTKSDILSSGNSNENNTNVFAETGNIATGTITEIQLCGKTGSNDKIYSKKFILPETSVLASINCDPNESVTEHIREKSSGDDIGDNVKKLSVVQFIKTESGIISVTEQNSAKSDDDRNLSSKSDIINEHLKLDSSDASNVTLNNKLKVLSTELCDLTTIQDLPSVKSYNCASDHCNDVNVSDSDLKNNISDSEKPNHVITKFEKCLFDENSTNSKHLLCHMRVYETEPVEQKLENSIKISDELLKIKEPIIKASGANQTFDNQSEKSISTEKCFLESKVVDKNIDTSVIKTTCNYSPSIYNQDFNEPSALNLNSEKNIVCDQKVPECDMHAYHNFQHDQKVPEFELSLLEFEEMCSKYMCQNNPEYDSTIPLYRNSSKQKSVLEMNIPFVYPSLQTNDSSKIHLNDKLDDSVSLKHNDSAKQNIEISNHSDLQNSCHNFVKKSSLPLPPKQWTNYEESMIVDSCSDEYIDKEQCTKVRGKNLCQEPYQSLPTTVMLSDSDLEGIDTPQLSSTPQALEIKGGRDHIVTSEKHLPDDHTFQKDMISNVGVTISTLNSVLDYSLTSENSGKASVYLDSQIRDTYRGPRAICDPLVYSTDVSKGFETLIPENYLNGHNFCDKRSLGLSDVISDYIPPGNGLIEISNPYEEDTFLLPRDLSNRNFTKNLSCSFSDTNKDYTAEKINSDNGNNLGIPTKISDGNSNSQTSETKVIISFVDNGNSVKQMSNHNDTSDISAENDKLSLINAKEASKSKKVKNVEHKNAINRNKNSMIPCRTKGYSDVESKRIETKLKSKKSNSLPRFNKSESHLPVKSNISHRVFSNSCKDSVVELHRGKKKDLSVSKTDGIISNNTSCDNLVVSDSNSNLLNENTTMLVDSKCSVANSDSKIHRIRTSSLTESSIYTNEVPNLKSNYQNSLLTTETCKIALSHSVEDVCSSPEIRTKGLTISVSSINSDENNDVKLTNEFCPLCLHVDQEHIDGYTEGIKYHYCSKHLDTPESLRRFSLPAVGMHKSNYTSSKESLNSQLTSSSYRGKSRIPRKQTGARGTPSKGPVRPPMWLSKAELTQEIQRLGTLCEARTKELNRLKMETKHVSSGFDAFAALFKYMVEDLNGLSVPALTKDLEKTLKQLELTKQDLAFYEREVEEMKSHHCQELNDLSNRLFEVYQSEVAELNAKHQEEINHLKSEHQKQLEVLKTTYDASSAEAKAHHEKMIASLEQEIINQREELQQYQERELKDLEEKHSESTKLLQDHIEQLQKKCAELKQHSMSMEDAMRKDTDSKLQWVSAAKLDLEKEVESLKTVLEMKNKELHTIRVQNLEMEKQLEELPFAREKIKMLQARAEDLEALMIEKTKLERKLSTENQQLKDTYEKEAKVKRRLSMENEELQWRLRQAENSLIAGSFNEVPEFPEVEENAATSPTKSPGPQLLSRSVFFTYLDKDESSPHSPRSQYKKITPNFAANYKTSPAKSSKSPPVPSPRRGKSHSDPPQPLTNTSTPRKIAKQSLNKTKLSQKRQRSGSDSGRLSEPTEVNYSSVTESMTSSVSSESSVFEQQERLLEEHKEQIFHSLEILREQRSTESSTDEPTTMGKKWCSDDIKITGDLPNLEMEDMSRSAEFSDPKTYYHMTFPVLKESGVTDCDIDDSSGKNSGCGNSPVKEVPNSIKHSTLENNMDVVEATGTSQNISMSFQEIERRVVSVGNKRNSCTESTLSAENVQRKASNCDKNENRWRTI